MRCRLSSLARFSPLSVCSVESVACEGCVACGRACRFGSRARVATLASGDFYDRVLRTWLYYPPPPPAPQECFITSSLGPAPGSACVLVHTVYVTVMQRHEAQTSVTLSDMGRA